MTSRGPLMERLAVLGLGLLGGSLAMAARERGVARCVVGASRRTTTVDRARRQGVVDAVGDVASAVAGADLVVLATPVGAMADVLHAAAPHLSAGGVVTDVGSVKGVLSETLPGLLPSGVCYVGAHPMAGSHLRGVEHARADLFENAACAVTPLPGTDPRALHRVVSFWEALGARVVVRDPVAHDAEVAWVSHVPHLLAFAFAEALGAAPRTAGELAGAGFRDFTRIAQSDAELWGDILSANRKALAGPLQASAAALAKMARAVEQGDVESIERLLSAARATLSALAAPDPGGKRKRVSETPDSGAQIRSYPGRVDHPKEQ